MKFRYFIPVFALISSIGLAAGKSKVDLSMAFLSALEKTETNAIDRSLINQADAQVGKARAKFLPQLSATGEYSPANSYESEQYSAKLTLTQSLFQGGQYKSAYNAAKATKTYADRAAEASRNEIFSNVARSFFKVRSTEEEVKNLNNTIQVAQSRIADLRKRLKIGRSRVGEVLTAQSQLAVLQSQLEQAEGQLSTARDDFAYVTGLDRNAELDERISAPKPKRLEEYLELVSKRPDIQALDAKWVAAKENVGVARGKHLPTLAAVGNYYFAGNGTREPDDWDAGVALTLPLFEGGGTQAGVREAIEVASQSELAFKQKQRAAEAEVRSNYHSLVSLLEQIEALEKALDASEKNYREQVKDYRYSTVTNLDVIQALNTFHDAKRSLDRTRFDAQVAWANLKASVSQVP